MKVAFADKDLENLYKDGESGKSAYPQGITKRYVMRVNTIKSATKFNDLFELRSLKFEKIDKKNRYSVRINDQYRLEMTYDDIKDDIVIKGFIMQAISKHYRKG